MGNKKTNVKGWSHHLILPVLAVLMVASIGTYLVTKSSAQSYMSGITPYSCKQDPTPTLRKGSTNKNCVKALQYQLNRWIAYQHPTGIATLGIDGSFGTKTDQAVRSFQTMYGLKVDGVVGANTWKKLVQGCGVVANCTGK